MCFCSVFQNVNFGCRRAPGHSRCCHSTAATLESSMFCTWGALWNFFRRLTWELVLGWFLPLVDLQMNILEYCVFLRHVLLRKQMILAKVHSCNWQFRYPWRTVFERSFTEENEWRLQQRIWVLCISAAVLLCSVELLMRSLSLNCLSPMFNGLGWELRRVLIDVFC